MGEGGMATLFFLLHERAAQFSISLSSHALDLNDFDKRRVEGAEFLDATRRRNKST